MKSVCSCLSGTLGKVAGKSTKIYTVGIFTVVCGSFWRVDEIQNGGRCHGNQGAIFFKFIPNFKKLYSNVSCHIQICKQRYSVSKWLQLVCGSYCRVEKIQDGCRYHGNQGTKIMGWGDVCYCFAMALLVILPHNFVRSMSRRCLDQTLWKCHVKLCF